MVADGYLKKMGHDVSLTARGHEAVRLVAETDFDVILLDINLPDISGITVARHIRKLPDCQRARTPIIAMSAHVFDDQIDAHLDEGMDAFLAKPVSPERLMSALSAVMSEDQTRKIFLSSRSRSCDDRQINALKKVLMADCAAIGEKKVGQIVELYLQQAPKRIAAIQRAVEARDNGAARQEIHKLRGSAANFHISGFLQCLEQAETLSTDGNIEGLRRSLAALENEATIAERLLAKCLQDIRVDHQAHSSAAVNM